MTLTKYEKEAIILFNEGEDTAHIQTYNAGLRKRLAAFSKKHPDLCRLEKSFAQGGVIYALDKFRLSIRLQAFYSAKRRKTASKGAKDSCRKLKISNIRPGFCRYNMIKIIEDYHTKSPGLLGLCMVVFIHNKLERSCGYALCSRFILRCRRLF